MSVYYYSSVDCCEKRRSAVRKTTAVGRQSGLTSPIFIALHVMQTRSSDENSVHLSVRLSHACIVTKRYKDLARFIVVVGSQIGTPRGRIYHLYTRRDFTSGFAANVASASGAAYVRLRSCRVWRSYHTDSVGGVFQTILILCAHSVSIGATSISKIDVQFFYFFTYRPEILHMPRGRQCANWCQAEF